MAINLRTSEQRKMYWKTFDRARWQFLRWSTARMNAALKAQIKPLLDDFDLNANLNDIISKRPVEKAFEDTYTRVGSHFARITTEGIKSRKSDHWEDAIQNWIALNGANRVVGITQTTINRVRTIMQTGIEMGLSVPDIASRLAAENPAVNLRRATVIARTEVISASNLGSLEGARSTGLPLKKQWISTSDDRTREDHVFADGQTAESIDSPFNVAGDELAFPGDPSGNPGNVINCRCTQAYISY